MRIRPCIDLHNGQVKQIVGRSLKETGDPSTNFVASENADYYAGIYREKELPGGHIILLNSAAEVEAYEADRQQALLALRAYPGGMQVGGGITPGTAGDYLEAGASHVIVTSYVFREGRLDMDRLQELMRTVGKEHLVLDLSCRKQDDGSYVVVTDRWQKRTQLQITEETLDFLSEYCDEFLIHAADVEGKRSGVEQELVRILGDWQKGSHFPITYAGGVHAYEDLELIRELSGGEMDVTVGSALDLFGGDLQLEALRALSTEQFHSRTSP